MSKSKIAYWVLSVVLALAFGFAGFAKLSGNALSVGMFEHFGYPIFFMYFIGACEFVGALGLVFGQSIDARLPRLAAMGLLAIMFGAIVTHILYDPVQAMIPAVILSVLLSGILYAGKKMRSIVVSPM